MTRKRTRSDGLAPRGGPAGRHARLLARLKTAEDTLRAIQSGEVDALMVSSRRGRQVVSLKGGEPAYRLLVEAMSEGAATLSPNGTVLYCNRRFAELIRRPRTTLIGSAFLPVVSAAERDRFDAFLAEAQSAPAKGEFSLRGRDGTLIPVQVSLSRFLPSQGQALGMVVTDLSEQKRKQAADMELARATQRLLLDRTLSAQEEERRRIARELHDESGQLLTALLVGLRTLEDARSLSDVAALAQRLRAIAAQAIGEVGRLARGLHPTVLDDHGLGVALGRYVAEYATTHKIAVKLALDERDCSTLPPAVQIALYRILQEALTNVARHSGATSVRIRVVRSAAAVEASVVDDGCGFDAKAVAVSSHRLGIQSMRERAAMHGGTVSFKSRRKGTVFLVQLPLASRAVQPMRRRST
jgi:PAS domain S-box-containing protein